MACLSWTCVMQGKAQRHANYALLAPLLALLCCPAPSVPHFPPPCRPPCSCVTLTARPSRRVAPPRSYTPSWTGCEWTPTTCARAPQAGPSPGSATRLRSTSVWRLRGAEGGKAECGLRAQEHASQQTDAAAAERNGYVHFSWKAGLGSPRMLYHCASASVWRYLSSIVISHAFSQA